MNLTQPKIHAGLPTLFARVARNSLFVLAARAIDIGVRIVSLVLIARYLSKESFGEFAFVMAIASFLLPLTDFGVQRILIREISADTENASRYVGSALTLRVILSIPLIILIFSITRFFHWDHRTVLAIYIAACSQILVSFGMVFLAVFRAFERMGYDLLLSFIHQLIRLTSIIFVIKYDLGFLYIFLAIAFAELFKTILQAVAVSLRFLRPRFAKSLNYCKLLLKESYPLAVFAFLAVASFRVDIFVLKHFRGPAEISLFEIPHRIIMLFQILPISIVTALFPVLSRLAKSSRASLEYTYEKAFKFLVILSLPVAILMIVFAKGIMTIIDKKYLDAASALQILGGTVCFLFLISLINFTLTSIGKQKLTTVGVSICFCINLLMDLILVPRYGYIGASIGTLIAYICFFLASFYFACKNIGKILVIPIIYKPVVSGIIMTIGCLLFRSGDLRGLLLGVTTGILCYVLALLSLKTFSAEELGLLSAAIKRR